MQTLNRAIDLSGLIVCLIGLVMVLASPSRSGYRMKYWIMFIVTLALFVLSHMTGLLLGGSEKTWAREVLYVSNYMEFVTPVILEYVVMTWLLVILDPERQWKALRRVLPVLVGIHIVFMFFSQFTGLVYFIDDQNVYHRASTYAVSYLTTAIMLVIGMTLVIRYRGRMSRYQQFVFSVYFTIPVIGVVLQIMFYGINIIVIMTVIGAIIMMLVIMIDHTNEYYRQQEINTNLKVDIMLSQIQPHFMYNCLLVIRQICLENPAGAADALKEFTKFLRHNMESISTDTLIPFAEELEHVKCYVGLQQLRFGDELKVDYDLECTDFRLPTLTLQPLVENAIRYGARKREDGNGFVRVETRAYDDRFEVSVIDNGPGIDQVTTGYDEGKVGIALENVRNRLQLICGGRLEIGPGEDSGVRATMILPRDNDSKAALE